MNRKAYKAKNREIIAIGDITGKKMKEYMNESEFNSELDKLAKAAESANDDGFQTEGFHNTTHAQVFLVENFPLGENSTGDATVYFEADDYKVLNETRYQTGVKVKLESESSLVGVLDNSVLVEGRDLEKTLRIAIIKLDSALSDKLPDQIRDFYETTKEALEAVYKGVTGEVYKTRIEDYFHEETDVDLMANALTADELFVDWPEEE